MAVTGEMAGMAGMAGMVGMAAAAAVVMTRLIIWPQVWCFVYRVLAQVEVVIKVFKIDLYYEYLGASSDLYPQPSVGDSS